MPVRSLALSVISKVCPNLLCNAKRTRKNSVCAVQLTFAEGDSDLVGGFAYSESQYKDACCWIEAANRKIALKKGEGEENSVAPAQDVSPFNEVDVKQHRTVS